MPSERALFPLLLTGNDAKPVPSAVSKGKNFSRDVVTRCPTRRYIVSGAACPGVAGIAEKGANVVFGELYPRRFAACVAVRACITRSCGAIVQKQQCCDSETSSWLFLKVTVGLVLGIRRG